MVLESQKNAWLGDNVVRLVSWYRDNPGRHSPSEAGEASRVMHPYKYARRAFKYGYLDNPARGQYCATHTDTEVRVAPEWMGER